MKALFVVILFSGLLWPFAVVYATRLSASQEASCMRVLSWVLAISGVCMVVLGMSATHSLIERTVLALFALTVGWMAHAVFFSRRSYG